MAALNETPLEPETASTIAIIDSIGEKIDPIQNVQWIEELHGFIALYFKSEHRRKIRSRALFQINNKLGELRKISRHLHDEMVEEVVFKDLMQLEREPDIQIRAQLIQILLDLLLDGTQYNNLDHAVKILDALEKVLNSPFVSSKSAQDQMSVISEEETDVIKKVIEGLIKCVRSKFYSLPAPIAARALKMLSEHLKKHYEEEEKRSENAKKFEAMCGKEIRERLFGFLLCLRANHLNQMSIYGNDEHGILKYSPYLLATDGNSFSDDASSSISNEALRLNNSYQPGSGYKTPTKQQQTKRSSLSPPLSPNDGAAQGDAHKVQSLPKQGSNSSSSSTSHDNNALMTSMSECAKPTIKYTYFNVRDLMKLIVQCLSVEREWSVIHTVLTLLPKLLQSRSLILLTGPALINLLCESLSNLVNLISNHNKAKAGDEFYINLPGNIPKCDLLIEIFPALIALVSYAQIIDLQKQKNLILTFKLGLSTKAAKSCITALTLCSMEMQDAMVKCLPTILLSLSKMSATSASAVPKLEFLSNLILWPGLYVNLTPQEYMSIFATCLPYTNPFKFEEFIVALTHRVIALWFLACKCRRQFVDYIIKGLKTNVQQPIEEAERMSRVTQLDRQQSLQGGGDASAAKRSEHPSLFARMSSQLSRSNSTVEHSTSSSIGGRSGGDLLLGSATGHAAPLGTPTPLSPPPATPSSPSLFSFNSDAIQALKARDSHFSFTHDSHRRRLNEELMVTCMDLLARYTYGMCTSVPRETSKHFLRAQDNLKCSWVVGNKIVTITTSGCGSRPFYNNLCESCWRSCRPSYCAEPRAPYLPSFVQRLPDVDQSEDIASTLSVRRRHQTEHIPGQVSNHENGLSENGRLSGMGTKIFRDDQQLQSGPSLHHHGNSGAAASASNWTTACTCWCQAYAEIHIRRPTGNTAFEIKLLNPLGNVTLSTSPPDNHCDILANNYFFPSIEEEETCRKSESESNDSTPIASGASLTPLTPKGVCNGVPPSNGFSNDQSPGNQSYEETSPCNTVRTVPSENLIGSPLRSSSSPDLDAKPAFDSNLADAELGEEANEELKFSKSENLGEPDKNSVNLENKSPSKVERTQSFTGFIKSLRRSPSGSNNADKNKGLFNDSKTKEPCTPSTSSTGSTPYSSQYSSKVSLNDAAAASNSPQKISTSSTAQFYRERSITVSGSVTPGERKQIQRKVQSPYQRSQAPVNNIAPPIKPTQHVYSALSPQFVFLQFFHNPDFSSSSEKPLLIPPDEEVTRGIRNLDRIYPYETHKIGVVYVDKGQTRDRSAILANEGGTDRYHRFLSRLGTYVKLASVDPKHRYLGGLETNGDDGTSSYFWEHSSLTQMVFHIATLMPNKPNDPNSNKKYQHIGNDYVCIIYNDSGEQFPISTIRGEKGQYIYACVIVTPMDHDTYLVTLETISDELSDAIGHRASEPLIISDQVCPVFVRQLALHANLASLVFRERLRQQLLTPQPAAGDHVTASNTATALPKNTYVSNWVERLRYIKRIKAKVKEFNKQKNSRHHFGPFDTRESGNGVPASEESHQNHHHMPFPDDFTCYV